MGRPRRRPLRAPGGGLPAGAAARADAERLLDRRLDRGRARAACSRCSRPAARRSVLLSFPLGTLFPWFLLGRRDPACRSGACPRWLSRSAWLSARCAPCSPASAPTPAAYFSRPRDDLPALLAAACFARRACRAAAASLDAAAAAAALVLLDRLRRACISSCRRPAQPQEWLLVLWMFATPPLLGLQLRVGAEWARRHLDPARRELERTIAERTAELARVNASLRRSEERYRTVSELSSDLSFGFRIWRDGRVEGEWVTDAFGADDRLRGARDRRGPLARADPSGRSPRARASPFASAIETAPSGRSCSGSWASRAR